MLLYAVVETAAAVLKINLLKNLVNMLTFAKYIPYPSNANSSSYIYICIMIHIA